MAPRAIRDPMLDVSNFAVLKPVMPLERVAYRNARNLEGYGSGALAKLHKGFQVFLCPSHLLRADQF